MSRPTVRDPRPKPRKPAITPTPNQVVMRRTVPCGCSVRSNALPGDVLERTHLYVGFHISLAADTGVGPEDHPGADAGPRPYHGASGDPGPRPHLCVPFHHGSRSQKTVATHSRLRMYSREELSPKVPQGIGDPQPGRVVRYRNHDVYRLDREHALEHLDVT